MTTSKAEQETTVYWPEKAVIPSMAEREWIACGLKGAMILSTAETGMIA
jgi:hypothetical protein